MPDSNINEAASHGFVKFTIYPQDTTPLQSIIQNRAAIYFDFNDPIFTNTTTHKVGIDFITVSTWLPVLPAYQIKVVPNPFSVAATLEVIGLYSRKPLQLQVFDLLGRLIQVLESDQPTFVISSADWPSGMYMFRVDQGGQVIGTGKLVKGGW